MTGLFYWLYLFRHKFPGSILVPFERIFNFLFYKIGTGSYALYLLHYPLLMVLKQQNTLTIIELLVIIMILIIFCIFLEKYAVSQKWGFLNASIFLRELKIDTLLLFTTNF